MEAKVERQNQEFTQDSGKKMEDISSIPDGKNFTETMDNLRTLLQDLQNNPFVKEKAVEMQQLYDTFQGKLRDNHVVIVYMVQNEHSRQTQQDIQATLWKDFQNIHYDIKKASTDLKKTVLSIPAGIEAAVKEKIQQTINKACENVVAVLNKGINFLTRQREKIEALSQSQERFKNTLQGENLVVPAQQQVLETFREKEETLDYEHKAQDIATKTIEKDKRENEQAVNRSPEVESSQYNNANSIKQINFIKQIESQKKVDKIKHFQGTTKTLPDLYRNDYKELLTQGMPRTEIDEKLTAKFLMTGQYNKHQIKEVIKRCSPDAALSFHKEQYANALLKKVQTPEFVIKMRRQAQEVSR